MKNVNNNTLVSTTLKVKLTGDGTFIGKHIHVVNIAFTLLNEGNCAMSANGNHTIAVLKVKEDYENIKSELSDIINEVENLKFIVFNGIHYYIDWYLGGDWKFLAMVCGIGNAISEFPCIWCKCPTSDKFDICKEWSITDPFKGARTVDEIIRLSPRKGTLATKFSCKHPPLFPSIPIFKVVIDTLHLFLRKTDNLQNLLILELRRQDAIDKKSAFNNDLDRNKYKHMASFEKFVNEECNIDFHWYVDKESKKLKWRDFTGPEKLTPFSRIKNY